MSAHNRVKHLKKHMQKLALVPEPEPDPHYGHGLLQQATLLAGQAPYIFCTPASLLLYFFINLESTWNSSQIHFYGKLYPNFVLISFVKLNPKWLKTIKAFHLD